MDYLKHPSRAFLAILGVIIIGVTAGIVVLIGLHAAPPETPIQKLNSDGYTQAPGVSDSSLSDIGVNSQGQAEWASAGCQAESGFKNEVKQLGYTGRITVSCSMGFLLVNADSSRDLVSFAAQIGG